MGDDSFEGTAFNLAHVIDAILVAERTRARRVELIRHQVLHAIRFGYKVGKKFETKGDGDE